jgi:hypothetical protein
MLKMKKDVPFWPFFALLLFGSLVWAHLRDPFRLMEFGTPPPQK